MVYPFDLPRAEVHLLQSLPCLVPVFIQLLSDLGLLCGRKTFSLALFEKGLLFAVKVPQLFFKPEEFISMIFLLFFGGFIVCSLYYVDYRGLSFPDLFANAQDFLDGKRGIKGYVQDLSLTFFYPLCNLNLFLFGEKGNRAHLLKVHPYRISNPSKKLHYRFRLSFRLRLELLFSLSNPVFGYL